MRSLRNKSFTFKYLTSPSTPYTSTERNAPKLDSVTKMPKIPAVDTVKDILIMARNMAPDNGRG